MGTRGPAPRRDDERRRRNKKPTATTAMGADDLNALPFEVDLHPEPPAIPTGDDLSTEFHPVVQAFWESLQVDPARKWMTAADWAAVMIVCETMSRELRPVVVGITKQGEVVMGVKPPMAASVGNFLRMLDHIGVTEAARMRMQKEITLFSTEQPALASVADIADAREEEVQ